METTNNAATKDARQGCTSLALPSAAQQLDGRASPCYEHPRHNLDQPHRQAGRATQLPMQIGVKGCWEARRTIYLVWCGALADGHKL